MSQTFQLVFSSTISTTLSFSFRGMQYYIQLYQPKLWEQWSPYDESLPGDRCRVMVQAKAGCAAAADVSTEPMGVNVL